MAKTFSNEQLSAINTRDRTLLVSAAAGSGKTTTLTERIIRSLLDEKKPESLENMLIVTFTNASTADMGRKISEALKEAIKLNPENRRLEKELYLLPSARISTIDSFLNEIVRTNADRVGIPPNYRLAEKAECTILECALIDNLIAAAFDSALPEVGTPEEFEAMCDCLTDTKSTKNLSDIFRLLHEKSKSAIEGVGIYQLLANNYLQKEGFAVEETPYGRDLINTTKDAIKFYTGVLYSLADELGSGTASEAADGAAHRQNAERLEGLEKLDTYVKFRDALAKLTFFDMPRCAKKGHTEILDFGRDEFMKVKRSLAKIYTDFYIYTEEMWHTLFAELYKKLSCLARFMHTFDVAYTKEKVRRGMLEHSDVSRFAYACLYNEDGTRSDIAEAYAKRFTSVYIDEYQDVNALQDAIFSAVSNNNRFMVGDIKQSIYGFRSAKPEIFAEMKGRFPKLVNGEYSPASSIFMSQNFRCDRGIIDFTNEVFDRMFGIVKESIGFVPEDALVFAKKYKDNIEPPYCPTEIYLIKKPDSDDLFEEKTYEPRFVARKIRELIDGGTLANGEPVKPSDIAILLRKKDGFESFATALADEGVPCEGSNPPGYFMNSEVLLTLCLLNAIDNPQKDIYLAGLMCSPLYGFTADDLLNYRMTDKEGTLWRAVCRYAEENPEDERLRRFITTLTHYRCLAEGMNVDALIYRLYNETGLLALASKHGGKDNLMLLYNYARKFEASSFKGLYSFINYVNNVAAREGGLEDSDNKVSDGNTVKIITVHSSKGLEYPIVFLSEGSRGLTNRDLNERIAYAEGYGMSFNLRAPDGLALVRNPMQSIIHEKINRKFYEEELRVLYVALTRAKERLFVTGDLRAKSPDAYFAEMAIKGRALTPYGITKLNSYLDIIMASGAQAKVEYIEDFDPTEGKDDIETEECDDLIDEKDEIPVTMAKEIHEEIIERFRYEYHDKVMTEIPEKMSVSRLYPSVLDGSEDNALVFDSGSYEHEAAEGEVVRRDPLPDFMTGTEADESARRGIATHMVLQFCDLENLKTSGARAELERLSAADFLSKRNKERVRIYEIELFARSELFGKMLNAKNLYRELRFNCRLPANLFTKDEAKRERLRDTGILVQGVIDCLIEDSEGNLHLVDYKTDRLTREELANIDLATKKLNDKHSLQLSYYAMAIKKMFGREPSTVSVYSMPLGKTVPIKVQK